MIPVIDPAALQVELESPNPPCILDVREADELVISRLPNLVHVPLGELPSRLPELDPEADWVIVCRVGVRSGHAAALLLTQGFRRVRNLTGGMNRYAETVDPTLPTY